MVVRTSCIVLRNRQAGGFVQTEREAVARGPGRAMVTPIMARGRRKYPQQIGGALQEILSRIDQEGHFEIVRLVRMWPEVVGEMIARRTEITGLKFHTAVVKVSGAMWIQELNMMKPQILGRLREALGNDAVRDLRFVSGRLSRRERPKLRSVPRETRRSI